MNAAHDTDDMLDFAMLTPPTRPGPCRKAAAEETDATAARLAREVEAAPFIAEAMDLEVDRCAAADRADQYRGSADEAGWCPAKTRDERPAYGVTHGTRTQTPAAHHVEIPAEDEVAADA